MELCHAVKFQSDMQMPKIKACPFCDSENAAPDEHNFRVVCPTCGAAGPDFNTSRRSAILEWNVRAGDRQPVAPETERVKALASATG